MKAKLRLILLVGFLYSVFLLVTFPASQAYALIKTYAGKDLPFSVAGLSGTVWSGKALSASVSGQRINSLSWTLHPLSLFTGNLCVSIDMRDGDNFARGSIARGLFGDSFGLSDFEANLSLPKLVSLAKIPVDLNGNAALNLKELEIDNRLLVEADGTVLLQDTELVFPARMKLGNLKLVLATDGELVTGTLVDGGGPLQADGILTLGPDDKYKFTGSFSARDNEPNLERNLKLLGRAGPDGKIKVSKSGSVTEFTKLMK